MINGPDATAGSIPSFEKVNGTIEANNPAIIIDTVMDNPTINPIAVGSPFKKAKVELNSATRNPQKVPIKIATRTSFQITLNIRPLSRCPVAMPRTINVEDWFPMFPPMVMMTGR